MCKTKKTVPKRLFARTEQQLKFMPEEKKSINILRTDTKKCPKSMWILSY